MQVLVKLFHDGKNYHISVQSLRGGSKSTENEHSHAEATQAKTNTPIPLRLLGVGEVGVVDAAFAAGSFWSSRRMRASSPVGRPEYDGFTYDEPFIDNHKQPTTSHSISVSDKPDNKII
ncbi:hypothetical protein NIES4071_104570 (plasmid) [Calothrix sp. NIES-4071]|nr:hypothetical protein NIES4071_104570 [Calothrix sp. NIES-4071]BAZ64444.1 hypothetical protein NIES4105_101770 [Calothrix sp. NIES-4105]